MEDKKPPVDSELDYFILTDDDGKDHNFEVVGTCEYKGKTYYALIDPENCKEGEFEEFVIIRADKNAEGDEEFFFIDDDDEFDDVADIFYDILPTEIDCGD